MNALAEVAEKIPAEVRNRLEQLLDRRDGAAYLTDDLRKSFRVDRVATSSPEQRTWELCGLHYYGQGRFHEAAAVFEGLYDSMLVHQKQTGSRAHKGMPLCWLSDCHSGLNHPVLARRYLMLTLCEDAISNEGGVAIETSGLYFRIVWNHGFRHEDVVRYSREVWRLFQQNPTEALFPEWLLQELDHDWMTNYPSLAEASLYVVNKRYAKSLLDDLGEKSGRTLERLAHHLLACISGCRAYRRRRSKSTDYDVICALEGPDIDFRSEFGRYFVCECKDWDRPADFSALAKFCRVLDSTKCRFGILFSKHGITGEGATSDASREQLKVFQDRGMVLVVVSQEDLQSIADGANLLTILRTRYEQVRLDLRSV